MTAGRSSEDGGRFAGGHFAGGHDGMANHCKPITAYDFHVRYSYNNWRIMSKPHYAEKVKIIEIGQRGYGQPCLDMRQV